MKILDKLFRRKPVTKLTSFSTRDYLPADLDQEPHLDKPIYLVKKVALSISGEVLGTAYARVEVYTSVHLTPGITGELAQRVYESLDKAIAEECWSQGIEDMTLNGGAGSVSKIAHTLLTKLGWVKVPTKQLIYRKKL